MESSSFGATDILKRVKERRNNQREVKKKGLCNTQREQVCFKKETKIGGCP